MGASWLLLPLCDASKHCICVAVGLANAEDRCTQHLQHAPLLPRLPQLPLVWVEPRWGLVRPIARRHLRPALWGWHLGWHLRLHVPTCWRIAPSTRCTTGRWHHARVGGRLVP